VRAEQQRLIVSEFAHRVAAAVAKNAKLPLAEQVQQLLSYTNIYY
jgi:hypothetical protein